MASPLDRNPTLFGSMPTLQALEAAARKRRETAPEQEEARFQAAINEGLSNAIGFGVTGKLSQAALKKLAAEAEEITMEGGAKALKETMHNVQMFPSTLLKFATNKIRRSPEQMSELATQLQKEGVKPGAVQLWKWPDGTVRLIEGHHTSHLRNAMAPTEKLPVSVKEVPADTPVPDLVDSFF